MTILSLPYGRPVVLLCGLTGVAVAGAAVLGWRAGEVSQTAVRPETPVVWSLPSPHADDTDSELATLAARKPWGGSNSFSESETPAPISGAWRLVGIVQRGEQRYALVAIGAGPTAKAEYRTLGDTLPDGSKLVQIDVDSVTSSSTPPVPADRRVLRLFEKAP